MPFTPRRCEFLRGAASLGATLALPALQDLLGGQVDALADSSSWAPHVKAGRLRLLATWGERCTQDFPDTPTLREQGIDVVVEAPPDVPRVPRPTGLRAAGRRRVPPRDGADRAAEAARADGQGLRLTIR